MSVNQAGPTPPQRDPGRITARVAQHLSQTLGPDCRVHCSHPLSGGNATYILSKLTMRAAHHGTNIEQGSADIVITENGNIGAVVEIQETSFSPRTAMGAIDAYSHAEEVDLPGLGPVPIPAGARRLVLYKKPGRRAQERPDFLRGHAGQLLQSPAGPLPAAPIDIDHFEYSRNGQHARNTSGEVQLVKDLADVIR